MNADDTEWVEWKLRGQGDDAPQVPPRAIRMSDDGRHMPRDRTGWEITGWATVAIVVVCLPMALGWWQMLLYVFT